MWEGRGVVIGSQDVVYERIHELDGRSVKIHPPLESIGIAKRKSYYEEIPPPYLAEPLLPVHNRVRRLFPKTP